MTLDDALAISGGILTVRDHPHLASSISRAVRVGRLARPLPGVVMVASLIDDPNARVQAAALWRPGDPLCCDAAAHLTITPRSRLPKIVVAGRSTVTRAGFQVQERWLSPEWTMLRQGVLVTIPSLTVADLLCDGRTSDLHDALRRRLVTLRSVRAALDCNPHRRGTAVARRHLWLARENPWSDGEALMHAAFRSHGLDGWKGNLPILAAGNTYYGDAVFRRGRLVVELDGRDHHTSESDQRADRVRRNLLTAAGWRILVITMEMLLASPDETVALVRHALARDGREWQESRSQRRLAADPDQTWR